MKRYRTYKKRVVPVLLPDENMEVLDELHRLSRGVKSSADWLNAGLDYSSAFNCGSVNWQDCAFALDQLEERFNKLLAVYRQYRSGR